MEKELRKTGIDLVGNASWGTHFCQFYQTPEDLIDILVPYFKAGLENNEFCMWITAEPLNAKKAKASLKKVVRSLDDYIEKGQIEILDYSQWYTKSGRFDAEEVLDGWVEKEKQALGRGFDGLRLTGNTFWLEDKDWGGFTEYEEMINDVIGNYKMIAVCSYSLDKCGATEIIDVVANHKFALIKRKNRWKIIESSERKQAEEALRESEGKLNAILQSIGDHLSMMDKDLNIIWANRMAREMFGNDIIGKKCYEAYHQRKEPCEPYPCITLKAFQDGEVHKHDTQVIDQDGKKMFFHCTANVALRDKEGKPTAVLEISADTTDHKQAELALIERGKELENKTHELEELNAALKVLLKHRDEDKKDFEEKIVASVKKLVFPYVEKLYNSQLNDRQMVYLNIIKSNLVDIIAPFLHQLSSKYSDLTPSEIQIAGLVKDGKTTKEIADLFNSSTGTIDFHRNNLRKKLGLINTKTNLRSFLLSLT